MEKKMTTNMPKLIPITSLKDTTKISKMCSESKDPIIITKNGYADMVIMSAKVYEDLVSSGDFYLDED